MDGDGREAESLGGPEARVACDDDAVGVDDDRLAEPEPADALGDGLDRVVVLSRVVGIGADGIERTELDRHRCGGFRRHDLLLGWRGDRATRTRARRWLVRRGVRGWRNGCRGRDGRLLWQRGGLGGPRARKATHAKQTRSRLPAPPTGQARLSGAREDPIVQIRPRYCRGLVEGSPTRGGPVL